MVNPLLLAHVMLVRILFLLLFRFSYLGAIPVDTAAEDFGHELMIYTEEYDDDTGAPSTWDQLVSRATRQPINLLFTFIFGLAIIHTFWAHRFSIVSKKREQKVQVILDEKCFELDKRLGRGRGFWTEILAFFGEVEVVFGLWCIPLLLAITYFYDWGTALDYVEREDYKIPIFIVISVVVASSYPFVQLMEKLMKRVACLGGMTVAAWWLTIMTLGPMMGSLVKETVAMAITAMLLGRHFFCYSPRPLLAYLTLAMLFLNISVGGLGSNFASSAIAVVAKHWDWSSLFMLQNFGWKAALGIVISNCVVLFIFRKDFQDLEVKATDKKEFDQVPAWIMWTHVLMLAWLIYNYNNLVIAVGSFVLFLGFYQATAAYQRILNLREPILVGFFVASLSIHTGLQSWWIDPVVSHLSDFWAMKASIFLSAFNNNTSVNYMMTHIPELTDSGRYALVSGTMLGAGLTMMANGPNLVGYALLNKYFDYDFSPAKLFVAALVPTFVMYLVFAI